MFSLTSKQNLSRGKIKISRLLTGKTIHPHYWQIFIGRRKVKLAPHNVSLPKADEAYANLT